MRIAVLSDIHGNLPALEAVLEELGRERPDLVVDLGDVASGPLWPRETTARLMALDWPTIRGNHDRQALAAAPDGDDDDAFAAAALTPVQRAWLAALRPTIPIAGGTVLLVHGSPTSDMVALLETAVPTYGIEGSPGTRAATLGEVRERLGAVEAEVVLCGHTHVPRIVTVDGRLIVNAGSLGRPAYDDDDPYEHVVECGSPHARWAVLERTPRGWQAELRATAYDWTAAAARAEANGRGDWADQLASGRVGRREADVRRHVA
jgi:predicted phosphodiesterase